LQQQLKINANDPDIRAYLGEQKKKGKAPIFVQKTVGEDGKVKISTIDTTAISDMLSEIKTSTPIIIDNQSGIEYDTLNPIEKTKTGKFGSALSRNIHASIGLNELDEPDKLIDFLHGRSETSGTKGRGQTKKMKYALRPRGRFTQGERDGQQRIGNWINEVQGKDATAIPDIQNKVTSANYAIKDFFNAPATAEEIAGDTDVKQNFLSKVFSGEVKLDLTKAREAFNKGKGKGGSKAVIAGAIGTGLALTPEDAFSSVLNVGSQLALEETLDAATIKMLQLAGMGKSATPVGLGLTIAGTTVSPAGEGSAFEKETKYAQMLGVDRNTILKLPKDEFEKLDKYIQDKTFEQTTLKPDVEQAKGEAFRSMSDNQDPTNLFVQGMLEIEKQNAMGE
jgi:hypothetical protein